MLEFIAACHEVDRLGLAFCSSGNMSCRNSDGSWFGLITQEKVALCDIASGKQITAIKASVESRFHLGIMREHSEVKVVLHFQSPYATAIAAGKQLPENFNVILEMPYYIGKPVMVDFLPPGSQQLANAVVAAAKESSMIVIQIHGMVTYGKSFEETIQRAVFFELACKVMCLQSNLNYISDDMIASLTNA